MDAAVDEEAAARGAALPGIAEDRRDRPRHRLGQIGVGEDDAGRLAAQFQRHLLDRVGGQAQDLAAGHRLAGEADLVDVRVGAERAADGRAGPGHDVEHTLRQPRLQRELPEPHRAERGVAGRLEHGGVAGRQARPELPGRQEHREVPGYDQRADADRLA